MDKVEQVIRARIYKCEEKVFNALYGNGTHLCHWERELLKAQKQHDEHIDQLEQEAS